MSPSGVDPRRTNRRTGLDLRKHSPWLAVVLMLVGMVGVVVLPGVPPLLAKEGPVEDVSHLLLAAGTLVFFGRGVQLRKLGPWLVGGFLLVLLLEEVDWGLVYGFVQVSSAISDVVGESNLHNSVGGHSYLLFGIPVLLFAIVGLRIPRLGSRIVEWLAHVPSRSASVALFTLLGLHVHWALGVSEQERDELFETSLYGWFVAVGLARPNGRNDTER